MPIIRKKQKQLKPARTLVLSFASIIAAGSLLLWLPVSSKSGVWTDFIDCFFTATSATCVTGISMFDTFTHWSNFGQTVILLLMQIGGLGLVTMVTFFNLAIGRKVGLLKASAVTGDVSLSGLGSTKRLFIRIIKYTFSIEMVGAVLLMLTFVPKHGAYGVFMGIFMAVSSFCNAGFDVMGIEGADVGLSGYTDSPQVLLVMAALIFLGGIGFIVWDNLANYRRTKRLLMHTKIVLIASAVLIVFGTLLYFTVSLIESKQFDDMTMGERILSSVFASFSARTAGFTAAPLPLANQFSLLATMLLMFIGAAPASTAGGIKVSTIAILMMTIVGVVKGREDTVLFGHRVPKKYVYKSLAVFSLSLVFVMLAFVSLYLLNPELPVLDVLYEVVSSFSTTGLSAGISSQLGIPGKLVLCLTMFVGRVGPISLLLSLTHDKSSDDHTKVLPVCEIMIG